MTIPRGTFLSRSRYRVRGYGADLAQAFFATAMAMIAVITDPALISPRETDRRALSPRRINEILLVDGSMPSFTEIARAYVIPAV